MVAKAVLSAAAGVQMQLNSDASPANCPRCDSSNTKFCYFNNYSLTQPRHFCKACKRYWTRGGTLRNVPVGGGCRKNKRIKKLQSVPLTKSTVGPPENSLSIPATDLHSLIYGMPSANPNRLLFPGFALDTQLHGYEETFQTVIEAHLFDLHKSAAWGECYRVPLLPYDDPLSRLNEGLRLIKGYPMEEPMYPLAAGEPSPVNWNQVEFSYGCPEYNLSVPPLI